ncbi:unnamed protein product [Soboliphyme baturini]|uniref:Serine/threonine-protein phosphatase 2A activator n=1 Tax=Soboliphyme baturini TaxID=241478 RepID=A0A183IHA1_9BILA|nr:unnamed protein product [Soboliphyme baturini]
MTDVKITYIVPKREVLSEADMKKWFSSQAYGDFLDFVFRINTELTSKPNTECGKPSENATSVVEMLDLLESWIADYPPINDAKQRFGNKAFRDWHKRLTECAVEILKALLDQKSAAAIELAPYLCDSFGNPTRIDYGTGHESCFLMFLCCLFKLRFFVRTDYPAVGGIVFERYLYLCRKLQQTYRIEPAGSHGVWSLDDYQFVPFLWGSAQFIS